MVQRKKVGERFSPLSQERVRIAFMRARAAFGAANGVYPGVANGQRLAKLSIAIDKLHMTARAGNREIDLDQLLDAAGFNTAEEKDRILQQDGGEEFHALLEALEEAGMRVVVPASDRLAQMEDTLPAGWTEASPGGLATNPDPLTGGIIDREIVNGKWFVVFGPDELPTLEGLATRRAAFEAFDVAMREYASRQTTPETSEPLESPAGQHDPKRAQSLVDRYREEQIHENFGSRVEFMEMMAHDGAVAGATASADAGMVPAPDRKLPEIVWEHAFTKGVAKVNGVAIGHVALRGRPDQVGAFEVILYNSKGLDHAATDYVTYEEPATARFLTMVEQAISLGTPSDVVAVVTRELDAQQQAAPDARLAEAERAISTLSVASQNASEISFTSRTLAAMYPVKGSMPQAVVHQLYRLREAEVERLSQRDVIKEADLHDLDRGARAVVAGMLYGKCDEAARHALLHDEHAHVRSAAVISQSDLEEEAELRSDDARSLGM